MVFRGDKEKDIAVIFELWDVASANLVGSFATENEALAAVRIAITQHGKRVVRPWALTAKDVDHGGITCILAQSASLVERATKQSTA